jgi:hypothetical protein
MIIKQIDKHQAIGAKREYRAACQGLYEYSTEVIFIGPKKAADIRRAQTTHPTLL